MKHLDCRAKLTSPSALTQAPAADRGPSGKASRMPPSSLGVQPLPLPPFHLSGPGQELWAGTCRMLNHLSPAPASLPPLHTLSSQTHSPGRHQASSWQKTTPKSSGRHRAHADWVYFVTNTRQVAALIHCRFLKEHEIPTNLT